MNRVKSMGIMALFGLVLLSSCINDDDTPTTGNLNLSISGLKDLGTNYKYEGWLIVNGSPISTGVFNVDGTGKLSQTKFVTKLNDMKTATKFVVTIEPSPDDDSTPSSSHILAGSFSGNSATVSVGDGAAIGDDFSKSSGKYILATPTNGMNTDENSGVWWLDPTSGSPVAGLTLPTLSDGWIYEGWAIIDGKPVSSGKFTTVTGADGSAIFSDPATSGPPFPGEDFLFSAPDGVTFPTDLAGTKVVISVEPVPDNSTAPFLLKPLVGNVPSDATDHTPYTMDNTSSNSNPTGTITR